MHDSNVSNFNFQTVFTRLYITGFSLEGGTLLLLRNLANRWNISCDISGIFNAAIDFLELGVTPQVIAAAMHYFGFKSQEGRNMILLSDHSIKWLTAVEKIVKDYVMVS